jgi:hypothetical protein
MSPRTFFIKEKPASYMKHDLLFKQLIHTFFKDFLEVFFPDVHDAIDFLSVKPLSEEVHTDMFEGSTRRLDIVIETKLKDTDAVVIVHIEPQSSAQPHFHERMHQYFSLLYNKYRKPIIPIAVLTYNESWERNEYTMAFPFFHVLTFHFMTLHLRKQNWRAFIHSNNPAAAALLSTMGYTEKERIQVKIEFLKMMARMTLDPARQRLIYGFFETYLKLTDEEEEKLMEEIKKLPEAEEILELPISYEEKGKAIGFKEGKLEGKREVALQLLRKGLSVDFVAEVTKLEKGEIQNLRNEL